MLSVRTFMAEKDRLEGTKELGRTPRLCQLLYSAWELYRALLSFSSGPVLLESMYTQSTAAVYIQTPSIRRRLRLMKKGYIHKNPHTEQLQQQQYYAVCKRIGVPVLPTRRARQVASTSRTASRSTPRSLQDNLRSYIPAMMYPITGAKSSM
ncbi:hypothetical protein EJ06DRAFT_178159 [Trichodelitschia bisporula]|uniref:Uncharacterized protein n=1 Tax=Trichodelitschia bisporula TaxID=703511 RepID=A0A6G1HME0_9PEZI|nr:hypothetical protein EJ06DRAFT_178159 [Trichodelitschia bisporula]